MNASRRVCLLLVSIVVVLLGAQNATAQFIRDIQGATHTSPLDGLAVSSVPGIVTARASNGFFMQDPNPDANDATSEGIFVFTSIAPTVAIGDSVTVAGMVNEVLPGNDATNLRITQIVSPTVVTNSAGNPLPPAIIIGVTGRPQPKTVIDDDSFATFDPANDGIDYYESLEGMRVQINNAIATGPQSFGEVPVIPGDDPAVGVRTLRGGIVLTDNGTMTDFNPEIIFVDDTLTLPSFPGPNTNTGDNLGTIVGVVHYSFGAYKVFSTAPYPVLVPSAIAQESAVPQPNANTISIATFNVENLGGNDPQAQFDGLAAAIVNNLQSPDILSLEELQDNDGSTNSSTVDASTTISRLTAAITAGGGPTYASRSINPVDDQDGGEPGGNIRVVFLFRTDRGVAFVDRPGGGSTTATGVVDNGGTPELQHSPGRINPTNPAFNNSRKPLVGEFTFMGNTIFAIANHFNSKGGDQPLFGRNQPPIRSSEIQRAQQAQIVNDFVDSIVAIDPSANVVVLGDINDFHFSQTMDILTGRSTNEQVLTPLIENLPPSERYTYVFQGNSQSLDQILASNGLNPGSVVYDSVHINSEFQTQLSDHDPQIAYFSFSPIADLSVTKIDSPDPVTAGSNLTYTITVTNNGPDPANSAQWTDTIPAGTTFVSLSPVAGWTCSTGATITCNNPSFAVGNAVFTLTVAVGPTVASGTVLSNTATVTSSATEGNSGNESDTETTTVGTSADLSVTKTDSPDPVNAGSNLTYTITVNNAGPSIASNVTLTDVLPTGTTFVSLSSAAGWTCTPLTVGLGGTLSCTNSSVTMGAHVFTLVVNVDPTTAAGTVINNSATVSTSSTADPDSSNNTGAAATTVATSADLQLSKTDSPDPVNAGSNLSYQITLTNSGPSNAAGAIFSDTLPAGTTFVSLSTTGPWNCTTPAVGATGTVTCNNTSFGVTVDFFTLVVKVDSSVAAGTVLSNTATVSSPTTPDPNDTNNSATATTTVATAADMQITKVDTPDPVTAGNNITYTINVVNAGPSDAAGVVFTDSVPFNTTFVSLTPFADFTCTTPAVGGTGPISCNKPTAFVAGTNGNFTLVVKVASSLPTGTTITNTASVSSTTTETNAANNSSTATSTVGTGSADVSITKTDSPDPVMAGTNLTYTVTVTNAGPTNATSVSWSDIPPEGTTFVSLVQPGTWTCSFPPVGTRGGVICSIATLGVTTDSFTLTVAVDPALLTGTVLTNTADVITATDDPNLPNNRDTETTLVTASADLRLIKSDSPDPVTAGTNITYTVSLINDGPSNAVNVTLTDTLPANATFVSSSTPAGWTCSAPAPGTAGGSVTCTIGTYPAGALSNFTVVVTADPALANGTVITNSATANSNTTDPTPSNTAVATTTVGVGSADVSITKTDTPDPVNAGATITYTITVTNAGPTNAASAAMNDTLPAGTTFTSLASPAGWTCTTPALGATGTVSCTNPSLGTGSALFSLVVGVAPTTAPGTVISNTATVTSTTADPTLGNESATATTNVLSPANVSGTKTVTGTFEPNSTVTYTIVLTNNGPSTQQNNAGNELVDLLPSSLTLVSATATGGTALANVGTNTVTWNGSIAAGASVTITINAIIRLGTPAGTTVSNQGTVNYDADGNGTNESTRQTDSPAAAGAADPTTFSVAAAAAADLTAIPTLDEYALLALSALLAGLGLLVTRRT